MFDEMVLGYKKLKDCSPGQLVRFEFGTYMILSEYRGDDGILDAYISGSGESLATRNGDEWVAIIDLSWLELNLKDEVAYPKSFTTHQISDEKFIHGHVIINNNELWHVPLDSTNTMTLCGEPITFVSRGLINATCLKCREIWHGKNPVDDDE